MIDSHIHLDQYDPKTIDEQIKKWQEAGITHVVAVSTDLTSAYKTLELKQKHEDFIIAAAGFHPEQEILEERELEELLSLIRTERAISAVGEIGLPYYEKERLFAKYSEQTYIDVLKEFFKISVEHSLPVALHAVHEDAEKAFHLLQKHQVKKAHFHWLKAASSVVKEICKQHYYISVTPEVCYRLRDQQLAEQVPMDQLLIETDGPWRYGGAFKNVDTTPLFLKEICRKLANIKKRPREDIVRTTANNAKKLYLNWG
ncbi:TatD family hydrolase [Aeribacillus composti]|uniref:TatD family hydrolase n=1 Tax=Aeribacillus composti TaxID=1868734 RepID=A0ABY9WDL1_9BACI|nr:TatD family hydrolase [Aeribacillus composti]WNF34063.1 TatD family hydrolase [Aeribacillus composti]